MHECTHRCANTRLLSHSVQWPAYLHPCTHTQAHTYMQWSRACMYTYTPVITDTHTLSCAHLPVYTHAYTWSSRACAFTPPHNNTRVHEHSHMQACMLKHTRFRGPHTHASRLLPSILHFQALTSGPEVLVLCPPCCPNLSCPGSPLCLSLPLVPRRHYTGCFPCLAINLALGQNVAEISAAMG